MRANGCGRIFPFEETGLLIFLFPNVNFSANAIAKLLNMVSQQTSSAAQPIGSNKPAGRRRLLWLLPLLAFALIAAAVFSLFGTHDAQQPAWEPSPVSSSEWATNDPNLLAQIPVFYATDRERNLSNPVTYSGGRRTADGLSYGRFEVAIPREHRQGHLERPTIWTLYRESPWQVFRVVDRTELQRDGFFVEISNVLQRSKEKEALVFIHGFKVAFDDAIYRTAQLAYDLGIDGVPVAYSWPSEGAVVRYPVDQSNSEWTAYNLRPFLEDFAATSGAKRIYIVAHSMGNRALALALNAMTASSPVTSPRFTHIALTAPDIDADIFRRLASGIAKAAGKTTLYVSANDKALAASRKYQRYKRAGDARDGVVIVEQIDTVDVSELQTDFLGHSYYGDNRSVITDLVELIRNNLPPDKRAGLKIVGTPPAIYWAFRK